jgi:hypothetical protein
MRNARLLQRFLDGAYRARTGHLRPTTPGRSVPGALRLCPRAHGYDVPAPPGRGRGLPGQRHRFQDTSTDAELDPQSDTALLAAGYATLTAIEGIGIVPPERIARQEEPEPPIGRLAEVPRGDAAIAASPDSDCRDADTNRLRG